MAIDISGLIPDSSKRQESITGQNQAFISQVQSLQKTVEEKKTLSSIVTEVESDTTVQKAIFNKQTAEMIQQERDVFDRVTASGVGQLLDVTQNLNRLRGQLRAIQVAESDDPEYQGIKNWGKRKKLQAQSIEIVDEIKKLEVTQQKLAQSNALVQQQADYSLNELRKSRENEYQTTLDMKQLETGIRAEQKFSQLVFSDKLDAEIVEATKNIQQLAPGEVGVDDSSVGNGVFRFMHAMNHKFDKNKMAEYSLDDAKQMQLQYNAYSTNPRMQQAIGKLSAVFQRVGGNSTIEEFTGAVMRELSIDEALVVTELGGNTELQNVLADGLTAAVDAEVAKILADPTQAKNGVNFSAEERMQIEAAVSQQVSEGTRAIDIIKAAAKEYSDDASAAFIAKGTDAITWQSMEAIAKDPSLSEPVKKAITSTETKEAIENPDVALGAGLMSLIDNLDKSLKSQNISESERILTLHKIIKHNAGVSHRKTGSDSAAKVDELKNYGIDVTPKIMYQMPRLYGSQDDKVFEYDLMSAEDIKMALAKFNKTRGLDKKASRIGFRTGLDFANPVGGISKVLFDAYQRKKLTEQDAEE